MSFAIVYTRAQVGVSAPLVRAEVHISGGLPKMAIVGLAETAVKESRDRVRGALQNSGFEYPNRRIIVNLSPADLPKSGGSFDLPIALGVLMASGQLRVSHGPFECFGELALSGELLPVNGALPSAHACQGAGRSLLVPAPNAEEAALIDDLEIFAADHLSELCGHLIGPERLGKFQPKMQPVALCDVEDLSDVRGQSAAKRALEIAAAGGHHLLFSGPPGTGKTMLASRLSSILPPMSTAESLASAAVASVSHQGIDMNRWGLRPFRCPHHTVSGVALVGGGSVPQPGEISLAHNGVLFLDELTEFPRSVLDVLREPLESGQITISRAARKAHFPARFQLVAAMNPCPCGYLGDPERACRCTPDQIRRYRQRLSGPLLDRIDLQIDVPRISFSQLRHCQATESSACVRERVMTARARQLERAGVANGVLTGKAIERHCALSAGDERLLEQAMQRLALSPRAYHRILKLSRTIADLDGAESIAASHLGEALAYRALDKEL